MINLNWEYITAQNTMDNLIFHYRFLDEQIKDNSIQIKAYCRTHHKQDYFLLRTIPGIGPLTATAFLSEIGDLRRFGSFKQFASFIGLVLDVYQSGERNRTQSISSRCYNILRSYIVEFAWVACRKDPALQ